MAWMLFVTLLVLWLFGFSFHLAGGFIHLLLVGAFIVFLVHVLNRRRDPV